MLWKVLKVGALTTGSVAALGGLVLGSDLTSYIHSSYSSVASSVKDNVPIEFQIRRAHDLLDATGPELRKNVRLMAEQEVDIATLQSEIVQGSKSLDDEKLGLAKLRDVLANGQSTFTYGDISYTHEQLAQELSQRFQSYKEAELALDRKRELLDNRKKALAAASTAMDTARGQQVALQSQIEALESRYRLVQATSVGTHVQVDNSKLAQAQKVVGEVQHQLDVSERELAQEARFTHTFPTNALDEKGLLSEVDAHLSGHAPVAAVVSDASGSAIVR